MRDQTLEVSEIAASKIRGDEQEERRAFLLRCGRFAAYTAPTLAVLLSVGGVGTSATAACCSTCGDAPPGAVVDDGSQCCNRRYKHIYGESDPRCDQPVCTECL